MSPSPKETFERIEANLKYLIDLDLNEDDTQNDPLALALYYYCTEKNNTQNINKTELVNWARTYCYSKLVNKEFSKKKDTETTAAILAYATLQKDKGYPEDKKQEIEQSIKTILEKEVGKDKLYFGRPNFTAIMLRALNEAGISIEGEEKILKEVILRYKNSHSFNNLIGLPFLTELLIKNKEQTALDELIKNTDQKLKEHLIEYDDKLYIISALWKYHKAKNTLTEIKASAESTIKETPIMISDIINKGDISDVTVRNDNLKISRLYKAVFLDLLTEYKSSEAELREKELDQRYSSEFSLKWGAFAMYSLIPFTITVITTLLLKNQLKQGAMFWIMQNTKTTWQALTINTLCLILLMYLITASITGAYSLYTSIIRKDLAKDRRVWDHYKAHQQKAAKQFGVSILVTLILGMIIQIASTAMQKYLTGKS